MSVGVVIPAAGQGKRMGGEVSKQFLLLDNQPIFIHTLRQFELHPSIDEVILVMKHDEISETASLLKQYGINKVKKIVPGGRERQESVYFGLKHCQCDTILIHDAVRPFISSKAIDRLLKEMSVSKAAIVAVPVKDTIKQVNEQLEVVATPDRSLLYSVQTPQAFDRELIMEAHQQAASDECWATDDSMLVERLGVPVKVVEGEYTNIKITTPEDLVLAEKILEMRRIQV